jgi:VWFA-related protein
MSYTISIYARSAIAILRVLIKILLAMELVAFGPPVWAQQGSKISVRVNEVSLFATVHDSSGRVVKNLTRDDFVLLEDGVEQKIVFFEPQTDLPLTIGLLVDTSRSQTGVLEEEQRASYKFLDQVMRENKDRAFVTHFDIRVETVQGVTSSRSELRRALSEMKIPSRDTTLIYSAVKEASEAVMKELAGRKAFILLTDGVAFKEPTSITTAIEFAQRADTIIYPIRFADPVPLARPVIGPLLAIASAHGKQALHRMARETGGAYNEVTKSQSIEEIYAQIEEALRNQYNIGYTPGRAQSDGKYHKIKLTTKDRRLIVNARAGYYAR